MQKKGYHLFRVLLCVFFLCFSYYQILFAKEPTLKEKVKILAEEVAKLKAENAGTKKSSSASGKKKVSIGGYGEALFTYYLPTLQDASASTESSGVDFRRFVLYFGYQFTPWLKLYSEVEVEHVNEIFLEFAYLEFSIKKYANIRLGLLLIPVGLINKEHESPSYFGTNRPYTEQYIIPSTWREIGVSFWGEYDIFDYTIALVNGLNGIDFGLSSKGLRSGRQKGARALAENWGVIVDFGASVFSWLRIGTSHYYAFSGQNNVLLGGADVSTYLGDIHAKLNIRGVHARFLLSYAILSNVTEIILANLEEGRESVLGDQLFGTYIELGYDVLHEIAAGSHQIIIFARYETVKIGDRDVGLDSVSGQEIITVGLVYKPIVQVALKVDYEHHLNNETIGQSLVNASFGYVF